MFNLPLETKVWLASEIRIWTLLAAAVLAGISLWATSRQTRWQTELTNQKDEAARIRDKKAQERIAHAEAIAATANENAALLQKEAAQAKLELEKIRGQIVARTLSDEQAAIISDNLKGLPFKITLSALTNDPEAMQFAGQIQKAMAAAGFNVEVQSTIVFSSKPVVGIKIYGPKADVMRVAQAFIKAGLQVMGQERDGDINITVGSKAPPDL
jgi:hypothetical protein